MKVPQSGISIRTVTFIALNSLDILANVILWPFSILEVCGSPLLWRLLPVGGVGWVACQGFLVREVCVCVLVGGAGFLLSGVQGSVQ